MLKSTQGVAGPDGKRENDENDHPTSLVHYVANEIWMKG